MFWTEERMIQAVAALDRQGVPLHVNALDHDVSIKSQQILLKAIGRKTRPRAIYYAALRRGIPWSSIVRKANVANPDAIQPRRQRWPKATLLNVIAEMHRAGFALNCKEMRFNKSAAKSELIFRVSGKKANSGGVYKRAVKTFGSWRNALIAAGIEPETVELQRWYRHSRNWPPQKLERVLRELYFEGVELSHSKIREGTAPEKLVVFRKYWGEEITGSGLYRLAKLHFGSWTAALLSAGIKPELVRPKRTPRTKSRLAHLPRQYESVNTDCGGLREVGFLGFSPKTPEEILAARDLIKNLISLLDQLGEQKKEIALKVIAVFSESSDVDNLTEAFEKAAQDFPNEKSRNRFKAEAASIFDEIVTGLNH